MDCEQVLVAATCIRPRLFLSGKLPEQLKVELDRDGITHILQVGDKLRPSWPGEYTYLTIAIRDSADADIVSCFSEAFKFIDEALAQPGTSVLVHCHAGMSRSAAVVIGYLMAKEQLSWEEALSSVAAKRPIVMPNSGFRSQLIRFQQLGCDCCQWPGWVNLQQEMQAAAEAVGLSSFEPFATFTSFAEPARPAHIAALVARAHEVPGLCY